MEKTKRNTTKAYIHQSKEMYYNTKQTQTRRPASADRTARAANFRRDLEATQDFN